MVKTLFVQTPIGKTLSLSVSSVEEIKMNVFDTLGIPIELQRFHSGGKVLQDIENLSDLSSITLFLPLDGGKGGFGSLLRNQAQTRRKITNWDHSRDRDGRRIGNVKNENSLVEFFKKRKDEESKIQTEREQVKVMQNTLKQVELDIKLDQKYREKIEKTEKLIEKSVLHAKHKKTIKEEQKKDKSIKDLIATLDEAIKEQEEQ